MSKKVKRGGGGSWKKGTYHRMLAADGVAHSSAACVLKGLRHERRRWGWKENG